MSKFGELIDVNIPVLLSFYTDWSDKSTAMHPILREVAAALGNKAKVIKIDVDKNKELSEALKVKDLPSLIIYMNGEMQWRQSGQLDANTLITKLKYYA